MINHFKLVCSPDANELTLKNTQLLAHQLGCEVVDSLALLKAEEAYFQYLDNDLSLSLLLDDKLSDLKFDLVDGEIGFRACRVSKSNEVVAKAIGCKPHYRPKVLDATAGMGRDALVMAMLGCQVLMHERNRAVYLLLNNALQRLAQNTNFNSIAERLKLANNNSLTTISHITNQAENIDVIYLDPMFPERKKSALVKKEMRIFKLLVGEDPDANELLEEALQANVKRVVVKRPKGAPVLAEKNPSHEITAKKFRYDVYLK
ncbi:class I SAM-dependent methyltransferase [Aliikangiella sp. IMCC44359]|uniref:class I SAM-dependent methyltransferase n=1 Tax=Aliikangiella sp. IMCC44359 TaxID=3459125 RepID=UPI00403AEF85